MCTCQSSFYIISRLLQSSGGGENTAEILNFFACSLFFAEPVLISVCNHQISNESPEAPSKKERTPRRTVSPSCASSSGAVARPYAREGKENAPRAPTPTTNGVLAHLTLLRCAVLCRARNSAPSLVIRPLQIIRPSVIEKKKKKNEPRIREKMPNRARLAADSSASPVQSHRDANAKIGILQKKKTKKIRNPGQTPCRYAQTPSCS